MRVGVLGGGQLGKMLALAGYPLGIKTICFDASPDVPAGLVGPVVSGNVDDAQSLRKWASRTDVITYEWESFRAELVADLEEMRPVRPNAQALAAAQDRWAEKRLFNELGIPVAPFRSVRTRSELDGALEDLGRPLVIKTRTGGYDGKGQVVIDDSSSLDEAEELISNHECVAEQWLPFDVELSVIGVRSLQGETAIYPLTLNEHRGGILHSSTAPSPIDGSLTTQATKFMCTLLEHLDYVGVLALEMFYVAGRLIANEMAPRVHNSGHWTIEGAQTSQFENHLRAITGLPLGSTELRGPTAMINLIGVTPPSEQLLQVPGAHLHLYGKEPRPGRKLGHVTLTASTQAELNQRISLVERLVHNEL